MSKWNQYLDEDFEDSPLPTQRVEKIRKNQRSEEANFRNAKKDRQKDRPASILPK